jgi:ATP-dependent RNA helicase RhlE
MSASPSVISDSNTQAGSDAGGFACFEFDPAIERGIREAGFTTPRPIQLQTIPAALDDRDVLGLAQTGTGKTAAFALPILDLILESRGKGPRALVIAPTRELATQIDAEIRTLAKYTDIRSVTIFGGVGARPQIQALRRNPDIIVACPGRLLDLMQQGAVRLDGIETLVLDEADHMFDMGFLPDIKRILAALPKERQNLLFSATMPKEIRSLANSLLVDPLVVELAHSAPAETIEHALYPIDETRKRDLLEHLLATDATGSAIVFTRTKHRARRLAMQLSKAGHRAVDLQGNMSQGQRDRAMEGFRGKRFDILVATDIAARGIDVSGVSHVINFDVPNTPEAYTHRIGRTGRSENEGKACTFVTRDDSAWVRATERMIGAPIARRSVEGFEGVSIDGDSGSRSESRPKGRNGSGANDARSNANGRRPSSSRRGRSRGGRGRGPRANA